MENNGTTELKEFARRLLAYEAAVGKRADGKDSAAFRVCEKLRGPLGKLMGTGGFRALLSRALALAGSEFPWLRTLQIKSDGALEGLSELEAKHNGDTIAEGEVALVAHLLGLLVTFIGPSLTLRLVQEVWPRAALNNMNFGTGETGQA